MRIKCCLFTTSLFLDRLSQVGLTTLETTLESTPESTHQTPPKLSPHPAHQYSLNQAFRGFRFKISFRQMITSSRPCLKSELAQLKKISLAFYYSSKEFLHAITPSTN